MHKLSYAIFFFNLECFNIPLYSEVWSINDWSSRGELVSPSASLMKPYKKPRELRGLLDRAWSSKTLKLFTFLCTQIYLAITTGQEPYQRHTSVSMVSLSGTLVLLLLWSKYFAILFCHWIKLGQTIVQINCAMNTLTARWLLIVYNGKYNENIQVCNNIYYIHVPEKSANNWTIGRSCNETLYWPFCLSYCDPDPAFRPKAKAHVLYVYVILSFISAVLPRFRAVATCICPTGMKRINIGTRTNTFRNGFFLYIILVNIRWCMLKVK